MFIQSRARLLRITVLAGAVAFAPAVPYISEPYVVFAQNAPQSESHVADEFVLRHEVAEDFQKKGIDWAEEQEATLPELFELAQMLEEEALTYAAQFGEEQLHELINQNQFVVEKPGVGKIEYRLIDKKRVPRVVLDRNQTAYLLLDESLIPRNSPHLRQYISRTHMDSGSGRVAADANEQVQKNIFGRPKKVSGRDLVIVSLRQGKMSDVSYLPKPKPTQWKWWQEYFLSKYKKPMVEDFVMGLVFGSALQGSLTLGMTAVKSAQLGQEFSYDPAIFTGIFSLGLGTMYSTYRNWTMLSGSRFTRVLKQTVVSLAYAYGVVLFMSPGDWGDRFASISIMSAAGLMHNVSVTLNALSNNYAKDFWQQIMVIRDKTRLNARKFNYNFNWFGKNVSTQWKQSTMEGQLFYLIPWTINFVGLMTLSTGISLHVPGTEISVPFLQLMAIPFAMYWAKWYSARLKAKASQDPALATRAKELEEIAKKYENIWKASFGMDIREIPQKIRNSCQALLGKSENI